MRKLLAPLCLVALLLATIVALSIGAIRAPWAVPFAEGDALSAVVSLDELAGRREAELRIWVEGGETGNVDGYVVNREATTSYFLLQTEDGSMVEVVDRRVLRRHPERR